MVAVLVILLGTCFTGIFVAALLKVEIIDGHWGESERFLAHRSVLWILRAAATHWPGPTEKIELALMAIGGIWFVWACLLVLSQVMRLVRYPRYNRELDDSERSYIAAALRDVDSVYLERFGKRKWIETLNGCGGGVGVRCVVRDNHLGTVFFLCRLF